MNAILSCILSNLCINLVYIIDIYMYKCLSARLKLPFESWLLICCIYDAL